MTPRQVVAANREARKPGAVLDADGDTFLKNECRADKWLLLELSQVARVDTVRLAQARPAAAALAGAMGALTCRELWLHRLRRHAAPHHAAAARGTSV
jgi:hypothetical protein